MVNMAAEVKREFPSLYTKQGRLRKRQPHKYLCRCGHTFSKLTTTVRTMGIGFGSPICSKCGEKGKQNVEYNVWKRMENGQIEQEDFILDLVKEIGYVIKEDLEELLKKRFDKQTNALGTLVYFGYLTVDERKRDLWGCVEYRVNPKKSLKIRHELIR